MDVLEHAHPHCHVRPLELANAPTVTLGRVVEVTELDHDQIAIAEREFNVEVDQREKLGFWCVMAGDLQSGTFQKSLTDVDEHVAENRLLAREVAVYRGTRDAELGTQIVNRDPVKSRRSEKPRCRGEDLITAISTEGHEDHHIAPCARCASVGVWEATSPSASNVWPCAWSPRSARVNDR